MSLEHFIDQVAECVVAKLKDRRHTAPRSKKLPPPMPFDSLLNALVTNSPVSLSCQDLTKQAVVRAITKRDLHALLAMHGIPNVSGATLTAALRARNLRPFVPDNNRDSRCRYFIEGVQTQCYAFDKAITTDAALLKAIAEFKYAIKASRYDPHMPCHRF